MENIEIFQNKVVCPRCDGNGLVCKLIIMPLNEPAYVCDECEATWFDKNISIKNFVNLTTYVDGRGYDFADVRYKDEDYYWYTKQE
jgi:transposase-like protein